MGCPVVGIPLFLPVKMGIMRHKLWAFFAQIKAQIRRVFCPEHGYPAAGAFSGQFMAPFWCIFCPISAQTAAGIKMGLKWAKNAPYLLQERTAKNIPKVMPEMLGQKQFFYTSVMSCPVSHCPVNCPIAFLEDSRQA